MDKQVYSMVVDGSRVLIGGAFDHLNGQTDHAIGALDATNGATQPWAATVVPSCSVVKFIDDVGGTAYIAAEGTGGGCFDGTFAATASTGALVWQDNCLGATQAVAVIGPWPYTGSHAHNCTPVSGGFPEVPPGESHHLNAESVADGHMGDFFPNTNGNPLGPRYLATDGTQLFLGGDFTAVNKVAQQGFARFGPTDTTKPTKPQTPFASSTEPVQVTVIWPAAQDLDDSSLTYHVYRDGGSVPVYTTTVVSKPSIVPTIVFRDTGLVAGSTHTYRVNAEDPGGLFSYKSSPSAIVTVSSTAQSYAGSIEAPSPFLYWRLGDTGNTAADSSGNGHTGTYKSGVTQNVSGAIAGDADGAASFNGSTGNVVESSWTTGPQTFTVEAWFKTTSNQGGKVFGFGSSSNGNSGNYDRHVFMTNEGELTFGVYPGSIKYIRTPGVYNEGQWHQVVATCGGGTIRLYVDGELVKSSAATGAQSYNGYWRVGGDNLGGWPLAPSSYYFNGSVDEFAVYPAVLDAPTIARQYELGIG